MRKLLSALLCGCLILTLAADEAPEPLLTDQAGDANAVNGQGASGDVPEQATGPASYGMADLLSLRFETLTTDGKTAEGVVIRLGTTDPLSTAGDNLLFRLYGNVGGCPGRLQINVDNVVYGDEIDFNWYVEGCGQGASGDAVITGVTIDSDAWTVEIDEATGETVVTMPTASLAEFGMEEFLAVGEEIFIEYVEVRHVNGEPTGVAPYSVVVPVLDLMHNPDFLGWIIGQDIGLADPA